MSQVLRSVRPMPFLDALRRLFTGSSPSPGNGPVVVPRPSPPSATVVPRTLTPPIHPLELVARQAVIAQLISGPDTPFVDKAVYVATPFVITAAAVHGAQQALAQGQAPAPAPRRLP